jgi:hypothetical protein
MESRSSRRGFFQHLAREVGDRLTRLGEEGTFDIGVPGEQLSDQWSGEFHKPLAVPAPPTRGRVTIDDLLALADRVGLGERLADVRALARHSIRLTLPDPSAETQEGTSLLGHADVWPADLPLVAGADKPVCLARIDLAQAAAALGADNPLPPRGVMWCFAPPSAAYGMQSAAEGERAVIVHVGEAPPPATTPPLGHQTPEGARAVELSIELQLPRVWSAPVEALDLDGSEHEAWEQLRRELADRQGVELHDSATDLQSLHRLLGYPDERRGDMPLACELLDRGHVLGDDPPYAHPNAAEVEADVGRWRLLLQLTVDDEIGWSWGAWCDRLYVWIDEQALVDHDFSRVRGIAQ